MSSAHSVSLKNTTPKLTEVGITADTGLVQNIREDILLKPEPVTGEVRGWLTVPDVRCGME